MNQAELALPCSQRHDEDPVGFSIGWDHAHHGLVPPPQLLLEGTPIGQGWRAARAVFAPRSWPSTRYTRQWLALRIEAWRAGVPFDLQTVTPNLLAQIEARHCPVRRAALGGAIDGADAPQIVRLNLGAAYAAGNLAVISRAAAQAWDGLDVGALVRLARAVEVVEAVAADAPVAARADGADAACAPQRDFIDAAAWWRLAALRSFATPLRTADAARLPLAVLPPNRVRVLNAVQALQVLLTLRLASRDWCAQIGAIAARLPAHTLRTDFHLWLGALAPRLLEAQSQGRDPLRALEDAWLTERVQRRWLHFALALGEPACEELVHRLAARALPGRTARELRVDQALDGWSIAAPGEPSSGVDNPHDGARAGRSAARGAAPSAGELSEPAAPRARPASPRRTARTPSAPRLRATADRQPSAT
jgi:hypothetical protein